MRIFVLSGPPNGCLTLLRSTRPLTMIFVMNIGYSPCCSYIDGRNDPQPMIPSLRGRAVLTKIYCGHRTGKEQTKTRTICWLLRVFFGMDQFRLCSASTSIQTRRGQTKTYCHNKIGVYDTIAAFDFETRTGKFMSRHAVKKLHDKTTQRKVRST